MTDNQTRLIKKYPNRRLYDTQTSTYITLSDVKQLVLAGENFTVLDAKTSEDLTRTILLQIILDEESGGAPMFSAPMLSQMIRFYGNAMQGMMGDYLEKNIHAFTEMQNAFQEQSKKLVEGKTSFPTADAWTQMIQGQNPMMQNLMGGYLEQSKTMMMQMQEQMQKNAQSMFQGFQFPAAGSSDAAKKDSE